MRKIFTKLIGATLGLAMAVGVGVGVAANSRTATGLDATAFSGTFNKYTGALTEGDYVVTYGTYTLGNTISSNRFTNGRTDFSSGANSVENPDVKEVWHIAQNGDYCTLYNAAVSKYAGSTRSKNQGALLSSVTDNAKWTASGTSTYNFENLARSSAQSDPNNKWLRNNTTNGWASYASGTGGALTLYKKAEVDPGKTSTATTVSAAADKTTLDITKNPADTVQLTATAKAEETTVTSAASSFTWVSGTPSVATVSAAGVVTAVAKGTTRITASYAGDATYNASSGFIDISVENPNEVLFDFASIASTNSWVDATAYSPVTVSGVTITAAGGGNNAKYYVSDHTWRMYNGGSLTITPPSGKSISAVASVPSKTFTIANDSSSASLSVTETIKFSSITVTLADERILNSISASLTDNSKVWRVNDVVAATDLTVVPHYNDGDGNPITDGTGVTVTNGTLNVAGNNTVNVSYGGESTTVTVNALSSTVVAWSITGSIGETVKSTAYDLSGLTLHAWYDNEKTDEASSSVANLYELVAEPSIAGNTPDPNNTITVEVFLKEDTGHANCLASFADVPAPIANSPKGSEDNPYTVAEARAAIDGSGNKTNVYVSGIVSKVDAFDDTSKWITYWISDDGTTTNQLEAYRGKGVGGANFASINDVKVAATVTVKGDLTKYNSTYEFSAGNQLVSYTAPTKADLIKLELKSGSSIATINGREHRNPDIESEKIVFAKLGLEDSTQYKDPFDGGHFTITFAGGANDGKYYNTGSGIRVYAGGSFTIASSEDITRIELTWDASNKPTGNVADVGTYDAEHNVWNGSATSITFTRPSGSGHWRLQSVKVTYGVFESVESIKLRFGAKVPTATWESIEDMEDVEITGYGVALFRTTEEYKNSAPSVQSLFFAEADKANPEHVAINIKNSNVPPVAEDGYHAFVSVVNITKTTNYDMVFCAQAFIIVNGEDYFFVGEEMRESVRTLAADNDGTNLSSEALASLLS